MRFPLTGKKKGIIIKHKEKVKEMVLFMRKIGLSNNQLKIIAMLIMTVDHIGMLLFPRMLLFRYVGRLAFPIFAFMIAEGCDHTRSLSKYLKSMAIVAAVCQVVSFLATRSLMMGIFVTFSLSIGLIIALKNARQKQTAGAKLLFCLAVAGVLVITEVLPVLLPGTDFGVDYGFIGVALPVCVYAVRGKWPKLAVSAAVLSLLAYSGWSGQWLGLLALPLLALYNGQRGKWKLKWLFYLYYPAHLAILWLIAALF